MRVSGWKSWAGACVLGSVLVVGVGCSAESDSGRAGNGGGAAAGGAGGAAGTAGLGGAGAVGGSGGASGGGPTGGAGGSGGGNPVPLEPVNIDECGAGNAAGLSDADVAALKAGGDPGAVRVLYPYDNTVLPRGLTAPLMMWEGDGTTDAVYLHVKGATYELSGCYAPTAAGQLQYPQALWEMAELHTQGSGDPFTVEITLRDGGVVRGPFQLTLIIAQADLKGSIYYNSYSSMVASAAGGMGGAVLRITDTSDLEVFLGQTACTGCHSLSANGTRLITDTLDFAGFGGFGGFFPGGGMTGDGRTYAIDPTTPINPPPLRSDAAGSNFAGVYPDGSLYVTNGSPGVGPRNTGVGTQAATLFEMDSATMVANTGIPAGATMPTFSPDGKFLTFNDYAIQSGRGLAIMAFDIATRTASAYQMIYSDAAAYPGWPFFLPDNHGVVFAKGVETDFSGMGAGIEGTDPGPASDLYVVDVGTGTNVLLAQAMGFHAAGDADAATYLPFGAVELHQHYYPTVSPVAAGGYFWVFFDSIRHYGNLGLQRNIWGAALSISPDGTYSTDPSHPAFYLPGQELGTGNHRAFTVLDPCHGEGESCTTGIDCCSGFCTNGVCEVPEAPRCSKTEESCTTSADCCNPTDQCLAGFCSLVPVE